MYLCSLLIHIIVCIYLEKLVVRLVKWSQEPLMKLLKMMQSKWFIFPFVLSTLFRPKSGFHIVVVCFLGPSHLYIHMGPR